MGSLDGSRKSNPHEDGSSDLTDSLRYTLLHFWPRVWIQVANYAIDSAWALEWTKSQSCLKNPCTNQNSEQDY